MTSKSSKSINNTYLKLARDSVKTKNTKYANCCMPAGRNGENILRNNNEKSIINTAGI
jgi:hypothetical protein